jgi:NADH-quinone oxidoreductase subunit C
MEISQQIKEVLGAKIKDWKQHSPKRAYISLDRSDIVEACRFLYKDMGFRFSTASAVQLSNGFELLYHFSNDKAGEFYTLRVSLAGMEKPEIDSIAKLFSGADWIEREIWELMGINFIGHPNLKRLLLDDDWPKDEYPLRKK